jgi:hypothetical protein
MQHYTSGFRLTRHAGLPDHPRRLDANAKQKPLRMLWVALHRGCCGMMKW